MADRSSFPSEQADKFLLRMPDGMREWLKSEATKNGRSMNAEITSRLEASRHWPSIDAISLQTIEASADANGHSIANEILMRLLYTLPVDSDYFSAMMDMEPVFRRGSTSDKLEELSLEIRELRAMISDLIPSMPKVEGESPEPDDIPF